MSGSSAAPIKKPLLNDGAYNVLKKIAMIGLPALGALYFALAQIWHLPKAEEVVGTIAALNTFLGGFVHVSTKSYNNSDAKYVGTIQTITKATEQGVQKVYSLEMKSDPEALETMDEATFKIDSTGSTPIVK